jgi:hypothetical protein
VKGPDPGDVHFRIETPLQVVASVGSLKVLVPQIHFVFPVDDKVEVAVRTAIDVAGEEFALLHVPFSEAVAAFEED